MSKVQIGPRLDKALYDAFVAKIGGKEYVNKSVIELIDQFVNEPQEEVQHSTHASIQPSLKEPVEYSHATLKAEDFRSQMEYVDYLERIGKLY